MKAAEIFKQYIWLTETIYQARQISLQELNERWVKTEMSGGLPMARTTFNRCRKAIEDMFDLCIECRQVGKEHLYYIENEEVLKNNNIQQWMFDFLSISNLLMESSSLKNRILLEKIPSGKEYLQTIINAMKLGHKLQMTYQKFNQPDSYAITVSPYAIKVFRQRWYMLAQNSKRPAPSVYALDRITSLHETPEWFDYPSNFDCELYFKNYYGVLCEADVPLQKIVIRAYYPFVNYLRTLPLHHSQRELKSTPQYTDFEYYLCPTFDFLQELLSKGPEVEVLHPYSIRERMKLLIEKAVERYE